MAAMTGDVDVLREEVLLDGRHWPFRFDCRANRVSVELAGGTFGLRPLRWREKRNLARFAHLGERFVVREFVKLCMEPEQPLPHDEVERDVLWTLARWICTPNESASGLPFDPGLLARVTVEVTAQLGCAPGELDGMDAADIELLWPGEQQPDVEQAHAANSSAPAAGLADETPERKHPPAGADVSKARSRAAYSYLPPPAPGMNRIVILPEPNSVPVEQTREQAGAHGDREPVEEANASSLPEPTTQPETSSRTTSVRSLPAPRRGPTFNGVRISMGATAASAHSASGPMPWSAQPALNDSANDIEPSAPAFREGTEVPGRLNASSADKRVAAESLVAQAPPIAPASGDADMLDRRQGEFELFDSWSEQLEEAAEELGIGIEG